MKNSANKISLPLLIEFCSVLGIPLYIKMTDEDYRKYVPLSMKDRSSWTEDSILVYPTGNNMFHAVSPSSVYVPKPPVEETKLDWEQLHQIRGQVGADATDLKEMTVVFKEGKEADG